MIDRRYVIYNSRYAIHRMKTDPALMKVVPIAAGRDKYIKYIYIYIIIVVELTNFIGSCCIYKGVNWCLTTASEVCAVRSISTPGNSNFFCYHEAICWHHLLTVNYKVRRGTFYTSDVSTANMYHVQASKPRIVQ